MNSMCCIISENENAIKVTLCHTVKPIIRKMNRCT